VQTRTRTWDWKGTWVSCNGTVLSTLELLVGKRFSQQLTYRYGLTVQIRQEQVSSDAAVLPVERL
jgi:hypothetical protein